MRTIKRTLALFLSLACLIAAAPMALAAEYSDVPSGHWAYEVIEKWADSGVLEGVGGGLFEPDRAMTLSEVGALLTKAGYESDADGSAPATREQAVMYIARALAIPAMDGATAFVDDDAIGAEYKPYVNALQRLGYVQGKGNNDFDPQGSYTRAEAIQVWDNVNRPGIVSVEAIGRMYNGGAQLTTIQVEYNVDVSAANFTAGDFELDVYTNANWTNGLNYGGGQPGDIVNVGVSGKHVIISLYTDYFYSSEVSLSNAMSVGVKQVNPVAAGSVTIPAGKTSITNYTASTSVNNRGDTVVNKTPLAGTYSIPNVDGFKYYTDKDSSRYGITADGPSFKAPVTFNEKNGAWAENVSVDYAVWLPENYSADGNWAMVIVDHPASSVHPYEMVRTSRGPSYFITDEAQNIVKGAHGLDGLIVAVPVVNARVNDNGGTPAEYSALVQLWDYLIDEYNVNQDYVYGVGQSVGGMILVETNTARDNYFAGILMYDNQWGSNYTEDQVYERGMAGSDSTNASAVRGYPSTDPQIFWDYTYNTDGSKNYDEVDSNNYYWMISDDNIMITNSWGGNWISRNTWTEVQLLYHDLVGYDMAFHKIEDYTADLDEQNAEVWGWINEGNEYNGQEMGLYWLTFEGGGNMITPLWSRRLNAPYEWLLTCSRQQEIARPKLDLNKPFEEAEEQIRDESRLVNNFRLKSSAADEEGYQYYFVTGKAGAGTKYYNTGLYNMGSDAVADYAPGWLPAAVTERPTEDSASEIVGVTAINNGGKLAVAVQFNAEMPDLTIYLKGENVIGYWNEIREDQQVIIAPFDFCAGDDPIDCEITNVYLNNSAVVKEGAGLKSGSGAYLILETDAEWADGTAYSVAQRTTVMASNAIVAPSPKIIPAN